MQPIYIAGRKKGDKLILSMSPYIRAQLAKRPDGPIEAHIEWREPTRRARANRRLWGLCYRLIAQEMGESPEYVHELMKIRHLSQTVTDFETGEEIKVARSTATLPISEFTDYMRKVERDGSEFFGIEWPPDEDGIHAVRQAPAARA